MISSVVDVTTIALVAIGAGLAGARPTWRGAALGLGIQYVGVVVHLLATSGWVAGLSTAIVAIGIEALLLGREAGANPPETSSPTELQPVHWAARRRNAPAGDERRPWFDLSVIGLAIVGGIELAISRPLIGSVASDAMVDALTMTGLLYCLLGQPVRVAAGLLLVTSAANVLLRATDPTVTAGETLLLAIAQLALVLAIVRWGATSAPEEQPS